jgi:hypothetical protein
MAGESGDIERRLRERAARAGHADRSGELHRFNFCVEGGKGVARTLFGKFPGRSAGAV